MLPSIASGAIIPVLKPTHRRPADLLPETNYALKLSANRAQTVATYLTNRGIAVPRIRYKGYGKTQPKKLGTSAEANRQNQRVEVKILAK